jgi:hypothetical protein
MDKVNVVIKEYSLYESDKTLYMIILQSFDLFCQLWKMYIPFVSVASDDLVFWTTSTSDGLQRQIA